MPLVSKTPSANTDGAPQPTTAEQADVLIRRWMMLFNLDRTQMTMDTDDHLQEKKREHRPSRKQAIKFDEIADTGAGAKGAAGAGGNARAAGGNGRAEGNEWIFLRKNFLG